ncbi:methyltransferase domain-containing protein, partial [Singulisphaera rosea]
MARIPVRLKRILLPAWNRGHRLAAETGELLDAVASRRIEVCRVCGRLGPMLYRPRVIPGRLREFLG